MKKMPFFTEYTSLLHQNVGPNPFNGYVHFLLALINNLFFSLANKQR